MDRTNIAYYLVLTVCITFMSVLNVSADDSRFHQVPKLAILKSKIFKNVGAQGFVINTDSDGRIISTTDASDYLINNIKFDTQTNMADVLVVDSKYTIKIKQVWHYDQEDWAIYDPDKGINILKGR